MRGGGCTLPIRLHALSTRRSDGSMPVRIALDTNSLFITKAGTSRYVTGLLEGIKSLAPVDLEIRPLAWPVENHSYQQPYRAFRTAYREGVWARVIAPQVLKSRNAEVLHRCILMPIRRPTSVKEIVTVHDMALLRHPERYRRWARWSGIRHTQHLQKADRIIADSRFSADEFLHFFPESRAKVTVIHLGGLVSAPDGTATPRDAPVFPQEFFLFVGSIEPGKNLLLLRHVYQLASDRGLSLPPLVVIGGRWEGTAQLGSVPQSWHMLGHQPDSVLRRAYKSALALVFPSIYEGFGLPLLEAMSSGCPVICSRVASLPEIGGDAPCYAEMTPAAYLDAMRLLAGNPARRAEHMQAGREQGSRFSWTKCARETMDVYRETTRC